MPNWCFNRITVSGDQSALIAFDKAFKGKHAYWGLPEYEKIGKTDKEIEALKIAYKNDYDKEPPCYCLNALYPVPEEVIKVGYNKPVTPSFKEFKEGKNFDDKYDVKGELRSVIDPDCWVDGYSWCCSHWGTKWDIVDVCVTKGDKHSKKYIYEFETAWSPPLPFLSYISEMWRLIFEIEYTEPGMCFAGHGKVVNGEILKDEYYSVGIDKKEKYVNFVKKHFGYDPSSFEEVPY